MKTNSLLMIRGLFAAAALALITSAGNAQPSPDAAGRSLNVDERMDSSTDDRCHARSQVTLMPDIPGALDLVVVDSNNRGQIIGIYFDGDYNV